MKPESHQPSKKKRRENQKTQHTEEKVGRRERQEEWMMEAINLKTLLCYFPKLNRRKGKFTGERQIRRAVSGVDDILILKYSYQSPMRQAAVKSIYSAF